MNRIVALFPVWVLVASVIALIHPPVFTWFSGSLITLGLGVIMLGMGITLEWEDFKRVLTMPGRVVLGVVLQFGVMPFLGWSLGYLFGLPREFAVGLGLVACCPGGTASNVICYLARLDVALSVTMTSVSTLFAVVLTPFLTALVVGSRLHVDTLGLFISIVQVIILPVAVGVIMRRYMRGLTQRILTVMPVLAVLFITLIVASVIGAGRNEILMSGFALLGAVFCLHAGGFLLGYVLARMAGADTISAKTISIEVGMQNSGLGVVLARQNFASPLVAIAPALSSLFHSVIASVLAGIWRKLAGENMESDQKSH
ncbi:MAG: bile acid:sodium symporter family protein [Spirochaetes bacterium]|nr:bile acid:sodium symporter family protein [Spirochaetota bacterium]